VKPNVAVRHQTEGGYSLLQAIKLLMARWCAGDSVAAGTGSCMLIQSFSPVLANRGLEPYQYRHTDGEWSQAHGMVGSAVISPQMQVDLSDRFAPAAELRGHRTWRA
jgi:hypothetical protein